MSVRGLVIGLIVFVAIIVGVMVFIPSMFNAFIDSLISMLQGLKRDANNLPIGAGTFDAVAEVTSRAA